MISREWNDAELLKALALYYQIPFGAIDRNNPAVVALAAEISRTPSAVALKLVNLASLDPTITSSGRRGMVNASRADRRVFGEYSGQWDLLADSISDSVANAIVRRRGEPPRASTIGDRQSNDTEVIAQVRVRRGQDFFRNAVRTAYRGECCITGIRTEELLRASHIYPWSTHRDTRLDPMNGLCLNSLHDAAFDRGLVTVDEQHRLTLSRRLRQEMSAEVYGSWFECFEGARIAMPDRLAPRADALAYHREQVFVG